MFSKTSHYGIALGIINILFFLIQYQQNVHIEANNIYVVLMLLITVIFMILAIVQANKASEGELFSIRTGLKTGIGVILLSGIIFWVYQMIHAYFIEPGLIDKLALAMVEDLDLKKQFTPEEILVKIADYKSRFKFNLFSSAVLKSLFTGFFVSFITSLVINAFYKQR